MRRLGAELDVQPSAIYHHFPSKQALLAAVADEILARGARPRRRGVARPAARGLLELRHAMLACTDGADVVATVWAFGLGAAAPVAEMEGILTERRCPRSWSPVASRTLVHYVFGHAFEEQTALQAVRLGAVERRGVAAPTRCLDFDLGLDLVIDGLRCRAHGMPCDKRPQPVSRSDLGAVELGEQHGAGEVELRPSGAGRPTGRRRRGSRRAGRCGRGWPPAAPPGRAAPQRGVRVRSDIDRSASRRSTPVRSRRERLVPRIVTPSHDPPATVSGRRVHSEKTEPTSLQPSSVASKNDVRRKSHPTNAVAVWSRR